LKSADPIGIPTELLGQDFNRDFTLQLRVTRAIHLTHSTFTEKGSYLVRAEVRANGQGHDVKGEL
jgi:hypothetical protein